MKIKNLKNIAYIFAFAFTLIFTSCDDALAEDLENPEKSTDSKIEYQFTTNLLRGNLRLRYIDANNLGFTSANIYTDVSASVNNDGGDELYSPTRGDNIWNSFYTNDMSPISEMTLLFNDLSAEEQANYQVYLELGKICKAFKTHEITDLFGSIPFSEAFTARFFGDDQIIFPKYDTQEEIYNALLIDLKDAVDALKATTLNDSEPHTNLVAHDLIHNGDLEKWIKFANSLRLRLAMRISNVDSNKASTIVSEIFNNYSVIESNSDNPVFKSEGPDGLNLTDGSSSLSNRAYFENFNNGYTYATETMMSYMVPTNDPRLPVLFEPNSSGNYIGIPNSPDDQSQWVQNNGAINADNVSVINNTTFTTNEAVPGVAISAAEVAFLKAEAIKKGFITGNAQEAYENGIKLSIEFYYDIRNLSIFPMNAPNATAVSTFLSTPGIAFDDSLEQIYIQKWIHLGSFFPLEAWSEFRRTDVPNLPDFKVSGSTLIPPVRLIYPSNEETYNGENFSTVSNQNTYDTKLWWDVN